MHFIHAMVSVAYLCLGALAFFGYHVDSVSLMAAAAWIAIPLTLVSVAIGGLVFVVLTVRALCGQSEEPFLTENWLGLANALIAGLLWMLCSDWLQSRPMGGQVDGPIHVASPFVHGCMGRCTDPSPHTQHPCLALRCLAFRQRPTWWQYAYQHLPTIEQTVVEKTYPYKQKWWLGSVCIVFFGSSAASFWNDAHRPSRGVVINHLIELSPGAAHIFHWVLFGLGALFVVLGAALAVLASHGLPSV